MCECFHQLTLYPHLCVCVCLRGGRAGPLGRGGLGPWFPQPVWRQPLPHYLPPSPAPQHQRAPWRQPWPDNGVRSRQWRGGRGRKGAGDGGRWGGRRETGREGGNGVTLTEPAVDKTLGQIRRSRVWSLFCFPLLLLSDGISLLLLSDIPSFSDHFQILLSDVTNLLNFFSSTTPPLSGHAEICLLLSGMCAVTVPGLRNLFSSGFLIVFVSSLTVFWEREEPAFDWQQMNVFGVD